MDIKSLSDDYRSWGSSVNVVTRLWAGRLGFDSWQRQGFFSSPLLCPDQLWGQPIYVQWQMQRN